MFTATIADYQVHQQEMQRRAAQYRLAKAAAAPGKGIDRLVSSLGSLMVNLGQQLVAQSQTVR